jgi:hypothetical protein
MTGILSRTRYLVLAAVVLGGSLVLATGCELQEASVVAAPGVPGTLASNGSFLAKAEAAARPMIHWPWW